VVNECVEADAWLREKNQQQDSLPKHAPPVLLSADVQRKAEAVDRFCKPIMTKPKPKPPTTKPETPPAATTPPSASPSSHDGGGTDQQQPEAATSGAGNEVPTAAESEAMEETDGATAP
ncbi:hypothetical protein M569_01884, partial [Genlisea aurea]